ncbi:MAG: LysM peptidoglycan-binding domain-containing protein, partial [Synergistaceae bacterium]|nr:LysM peptidoglycan-binding domain-containing protein [Synergistaceae bacterium]
NSFGNTSYYQEGQKVVFTGNVTLLAKWEQVTEAYTVYTVVNGDTLWEIAKRELGDGNRYTDIMILNDLTSTFISPGQKLQIPNKECKVYIVFSGDTLWEISKRELGDGNRYIEIMTLNNLDSTYLLPGQILILPGK